MKKTFQCVQKNFTETTKTLKKMCFFVVKKFKFIYSFSLSIFHIDALSIRHPKHPVRKTHDYLCIKSKHYNNWHLSPHHNVVHFGALGLYTVTVVMLIAVNILPLGLLSAKAASNSWTFDDTAGYSYDASKISTIGSKATLTNAGSATGSSLNLNPRADTKSDGAAQFTRANFDYLSVPSNASLQTGDIDFEIGGWFYSDVLGASTIMSKGTAGGGASEYSLFYSGAASNFKFTVGSSNVIATGTVSASTWYFVRAWHDHTADTINISVNNGAAISAADAIVSTNSTDVRIGCDSANQNCMQGQIDSAYFKKSITSADDATKLYNSGAGASYSQLTGLQLTAFQSSLTSWWDLDEESGTRYDAVAASGNNLIPAATQLIAPPVYGVTELIQTPGFETAGAGGDDVYADWSEIKNDGTVADTVTAGEFHSGSHAAKLIGGAANNTYIISASMAVTAGQSYALNFWTRGDGTNGGKYGIYDVTNAAYIGDASTNPGITGITYALVSTTFAAPAGCTTIRIYLRSLVNGGSVYFDDVSVKQITTIEKLNGGFETAGDGGADVFSGWSESVSGTSTLNNETTSPYSGSRAVRFDIDASGSQAYIAQGVLTAGKKYKYTFYGKGTDTSTTVLVGGLDGSSTTMNLHTLTTSYVQYSGYFTASTINFFFKRGTAISKSIWIDDITLESVGPLSSTGIAAGTSVDGNYAAQFNGTTQYLNITDAASNGTLQGGSNSFEIGGWFYVDNFPQNSGGAYSTIFSKGTAGSAGGEYSYLVYPDGHMHLRARLGDNSSSAIDDGVSVSAGTIKQGTWYNFRVYYDAAAGKMYQSINNQVYGSGLAVSGGIYAGTNDFRTKYSSQYFAGKLDGLYKINRVLTTQESTALYNNGKGLKYSQLPDSIKSDSSLKAFWDLDEKTGTRYDSTSNHNDLTDGGTVTQGYGVNYFGGAVSQINDISGNNKNFTQTTQSKRPVYSALGINNKPALQFDGVDDAFVKTSDQIGAGDITVTTVINPRGWGGGSNGRIIDNGKLRFIVSNSGRVQIASDASTYAVGATSSITLGTAYVVTATRTSSGVTNLYVNGTLSGAANQTSGTPSAGSDTYFGNISTFDRAFDGFIGTTQIYNSILPDSQRNQIEKTLGNVYGITVASTAETAVTSIYPSIANKSPLRYSSLQSFGETLDGSSTGTLRYQLSNDSAEDITGSTNWYYYDGSNWVAADSNNAWQSNVVTEVNTNLQSFVSSVSPAHNFKWKTFLITDGVDNPILQSIDMTYISDTEAPNNPTGITALGDSGNQLSVLNSGNWYNYPTPSFTWAKPSDPVTHEYEQSAGIAGYLAYFGTDDTVNIGLSNGLVMVGVDNGAFKWQNTQDDTETFTNAATLTSGQTYYLKVIAVDSAGNAHRLNDSSAYNLFTYKYDTDAPTNVNYVTVSPQGCSTTSEFTMTWNKVSGGNDGIAKYQYNLGKLKDGDGNLIITEVPVTDQNQETYSSTVKPYADGDNIFYIRPVDNAGNVLDNWQSGVFCKTGFVGIVDGPTITSGPSSVDMSWTSSKKTTSYVKVYDGNTYVSEQGQTGFSLTHHVKVVGLEPEKAYRYKLSWLDEAGNIGESDWYETQTATTPQIINLKADIISPSKIIVTWESNYLATSKVEYGLGDYAKSIDLSGKATNFSQQLDSLQAGQNYQLRVKAVSDDGANFTSGITFTTPPLPSISNLQFEPIKDSSTTTYRVVWITNVPTSGAVYYKTDEDSAYKSQAQADLSLDHSIVVSGLDDNATYSMYASGRDQYGNEARSDTNSFSTPFDSRPPKISNLMIEIKSSGVSSGQKAQIIVSWETDEPSTSQVEYGPGIASNSYPSKTQEDATLTSTHVVIVPELEPAKLYHLTAVSKDRAGNAVNSSDTTAITGKVQKSVIDLIVNSLQRSLGFLSNLSLFGKK